MFTYTVPSKIAADNILKYFLLSVLYSCHTIVVGIMVSYWLSMCPSSYPSVCWSVFLFPDNNLSKCQWIFTKLCMCINIIKRSALGLLMGKFQQFWKELSIHNMSILLFPDNNLSWFQWIFTKLGICFGIAEIWFGIANGQILSAYDRVICPRHIHILVSGQSFE